MNSFQKSLAVWFLMDRIRLEGFRIAKEIHIDRSGAYKLSLPLSKAVVDLLTTS